MKFPEAFYLRDGDSRMIEILTAVAEFYGFTVAELKRRDRHAKPVFVRQVFMMLCRDLLGSSYQRIGHELCLTDHGTVIYGIQHCRDICQCYPKVRAEVEQLRNQIANNYETRERTPLSDNDPSPPETAWQIPIHCRGPKNGAVATVGGNDRRDARGRKPGAASAPCVRGSSSAS